MRDNASNLKTLASGHCLPVTTGDLVTLCPGEFSKATEKESS